MVAVLGIDELLRVGYIRSIDLDRVGISLYRGRVDNGDGMTIAVAVGVSVEVVAVAVGGRCGYHVDVVLFMCLYKV